MTRIPDTASSPSANPMSGLLEAVLADAPMLIAFLDPDGRVVLDNHAYKTLQADMGGREPAHDILAAAGESLAEGRDFTGREIRIDLGARFGTRWLSCSGTWIADAERQSGLLLSCHDVTLQKRHFEQAKTQVVRALMAEQQMVQGMRETLSGAIFQLQGPLNMIGAAAALIDRQPDASPALRQALQEVLEHGNRTVERLRKAMPAHGPEAVEPVNINELIRDVIDVSTDRLLKEGVMVDWRPTPVLPHVPGRAGSLRMLVKHLLDNAIDAINEPGAGGREVVIETRHDDDTVVLVVADSGPGIPEASRLAAFEPFFSGWTRTRGRAGMGLALAQQIATDQGGGIEIEPQGPGCRVRATFARGGGGDDG